MTEKPTEFVAGVPTFRISLEDFTEGVCPYYNLASKVSRYVEYRERNAGLEADEAFQQFSAYVTITDVDKAQWAYYSRKKMAESESRLADRLSVGFGGHVNRDDFNQSPCMKDAFIKAAYRELGEEVPKLNHSSILELRVKGWIRDVSNPVGRVHLGIYLECIVSSETLADLGFPVLPVASVDLLYDRFETWSQIVLRKEEIVL